MADPYRNFRFLVEIDGIVRAGFQECSGFGSEVEVVEYREGGDQATVTKLPGKTTFPDIMLKWGIADDRELYDWHRAGGARPGRPQERLDHPAERRPGRRRCAGTSSARGRASTTRPT